MLNKSLSSHPDRIIRECKKVFEDVVEDFHSLDCIKSHFEVWRRDYADCYRDAYIGLCLPKLFNPLVRLQLITWNPLQVRHVCVCFLCHIFLFTMERGNSEIHLSLSPSRDSVQISSTCSGSSRCCFMALRSTALCREEMGISACYLLLWRRWSSPNWQVEKSEQLHTKIYLA